MDLQELETPRLEHCGFHQSKAGSQKTSFQGHNHHLFFSASIQFSTFIPPTSVNATDFPPFRGRRHRQRVPKATVLQARVSHAYPNGRDPRSMREGQSFRSCTPPLIHASIHS
jgi:hypothetical protein